MRRHKRVAEWTKQLAYNHGWELSMALYREDTGDIVQEYGTEYEVTSVSKKWDIGSLHNVTEGGVYLGISIVTRCGKRYRYRNYSGRVYRTARKRILFLLNEKGMKYLKDRLAEILL